VTQVLIATNLPPELISDTTLVAAHIDAFAAALQASRGDDARAVESWSRADHDREKWAWDIDEQALIAQILEPLRQRIPRDEFARLWQRGRDERASATT